LGLTRIWISLALALCATSCGSRKQDPAPPAGSVVVPTGAPNAMGAMAGGKAKSPTASELPDPNAEPDEDEGPMPTPVPANPADSGVTL
jgi:hypothetical protein